jgi:PAS domain S-box-containing protein
VGVMSRSESQAREALKREYAGLLAKYVSGAGESALTQAYELGRMTAAAGIGVLELAMVHHEALQELLATDPAGTFSIPLAAQFLSECLSPFEMTLRVYKANARFLGLGDMQSRQNSDLDRSREQLRTLLDATTAVIYMKDADGRFLYVNDQFLKVFEQRSETVIGRSDAEALPPQAAQILRTNDLRVMRDRMPEELEETLDGSDGAHTYLSLKFPLLDEGGAPYAVCCVATDITERKRADEALLRAKEAAEAANRELESFSYSVAHDLREPLRSIDGFSQALLEDCAEQLDEHGTKYLRYVRESAQRMGELIDDLLSLSRVNRGELRVACVDLSTLASRIAERLKATEPARDVEFVIQAGVMGSGDDRLIRIALENLIGNAWKFTSKRARARIEFGQVRQGGRDVNFIRDNGAGFDMAHAQKLFGPFQRLHSTREFQGTGIGLATVERVLRRHGGRIWAEAVVDVGATVYFTLEGGAGEP